MWLQNLIIENAIAINRYDDNQMVSYAILIVLFTII